MQTNSISLKQAHQNLPPTSEGLKPHVQRAYYNAYTTMHIVDIQLGVQTRDLDPVDYDFTLLENGIFFPINMENTGDTLVCHVQWWQMHSCNASLTKRRSTRFCILQVSKDGKLQRSFQLKRLSSVNL